MNRKQSPHKITKYLLVVRVYEDKFKAYKQDMYVFRSKKQRDSMAKLLKDKGIEYATAEE